MSSTELFICKICFRKFRSKNNLADHFWCLSPYEREIVFIQRVKGFGKKKKNS